MTADALAPFTLPLRRVADALIVDAHGKTVLVIDPSRDLDEDAAERIADLVFARLAAAPAPEAPAPTCQKCGGEIAGWCCQKCPAEFRENDDGVLIFDEEAATCVMDEDDFNECDCSEKVPHDLPENEAWTCPKCDAEWWGEPALQAERGAK